MSGETYSLMKPVARTMAALSCGFYSRAFILFVTGSSLSILKVLQELGSQTNISVNIRVKNALYYAWWIPIVTGVFACITGLIYPCMDSKLGEPHYFRRDWTSVVRCIAVFVGIGHFSTKSYFLADKSHQFTLFLCLAMVLWWMFDRSPNGLGIGVIAAILGTACTFVIAHLIYKHANFLYSQSWLPCLYFAGACTFGSFGRQLALMDQGFSKLLA
ncbi:insulin-induced gene 1 protein-like [Rhopilema esculentum]|uniref:insulin-induced gene 1 protein-like n=1 Tax=Rhopilema esculentum TaxID=499914 RepID=UPI0031E0E31E